MVIEGWQLADRQQTLFFDIKRLRAESHFHAYSLSPSLSPCHTHTHIPSRTHTQTQQRTFPLILLPELKDLEGPTHTYTSKHIHTDIYPSCKKWIKLHQPLFKATLWDISTSFMCGLKMIQTSFSPLRLNPPRHHDLICHDATDRHTHTQAQTG